MNIFFILSLLLFSFSMFSISDNPKYYLPLSSIGFVSLILVLSKKSKNRKGLFYGNGPKILPFEPYAQRIVYSAAILWALMLFYHASYRIPTQSSALSSLVRYYALTSLFLIFAVMVPGLSMHYFPKFSFNIALLKSRKAIGVSAFFFGFVHYLIAFFHNLGGSFQAVFFLSMAHRLSLLFGSIALFILLLMAITSFGRLMKLLGKKWKIFLHNFFYAAVVLVLFHAFLIGSHFTIPNSIISLLVNYVALSLILLEAIAKIEKTIMNQSLHRAKKIIYCALLFAMIATAMFLSFYSLSRSVSGLHAH